MANRPIKMPVFDLSGKTAIITGGSKGIGYGIAATFARFGANVVITARTASAVEEAVIEINAKYCTTGLCMGVPADSSKQKDIDHVIDMTTETFGKLDILVNNAGVSGKTAKVLTDDCDEANFRAVTDTNLLGVFLFSKAAAKRFTEQGTGGKIINIASVGGLVGGPGVIAYGASKAGVISLTKTLANELGRDNITVIAVCPGYVVTPLNEDVFLDKEGNHTKIYDLSVKSTAIRRLGEIEEIAGPVTAIACDCFSYMTGSAVVIDGGQTIGR
ncbi:MAG: glucose 1-dehydrogenase [Oscillospiraceae bacterium]|nr:glucose 1-dehydrogenase [Oscillospiraceae bacterium]